ncbi:MAG TPA: enoyl-CoA hydratase-related protein, partial [Polyangiaceae bacterium]
MSEPTVLYERSEATAIVTMNRPDVRNAQTAQMTFALDEAFGRAMQDDAVKVVVLAGAGLHFSAGHDIGTPERDIQRSFGRAATTWWEHEGRP